MNASALYPQTNRLCGYVLDSLSGESLIGASIYTPDRRYGTITNNFGFFSLTGFPADHVIVSYIGYKKLEIGAINKDTCLNIYLKPELELEEVIVIETKGEKPLAGTHTLPINVIANLPVIAGEKDILKSIQMLPGVQGGVEGTSNMYVRGGSPDQNLILLDGIPVYNVNHLFGIFSTFNTDAVNSFTLYKGYVPAKYGGRVSSVLDISMKEGSINRLNGNLSVGLISSKVLFNGPLKNYKTTWLLSARRTYIDILSRPFIKSMTDGAVVGYYFHDVNAKISHRFNQKHRLYLSFYTGKDAYYSNYKDKGTYEDGSQYKETSKDNLGWGNITGALRWNWLVTPKMFSNVTLSLSDYRMKSGVYYWQELTEAGEKTSNTYDIDFLSGIRDMSFRWDMEYYPSANIRVESGITMNNQVFKPNTTGSFIGDPENFYHYNATSVESLINVMEANCYLDSRVVITKRLKLVTGLRAGAFVTGEKTYYIAEPRVQVRYHPGIRSELFFSYNFISQNIHLLTRSNMGLPTDTWAPSTAKVRPSYANQYSTGYEYRFNPFISFSSELFYKDMKQLVEYKDRAAYLFAESSWQEAIEQGNGRSYGLELMAEKKTGVLNGWISYTLSRSVRKFPTINNGAEFPFKYDRRHYATMTASYKPGQKSDFTVTWIFSSGFRATISKEKYKSAITDFRDYFPDGAYDSDVEYIESRNSFKTPPYHRLDIGINLYKQKEKIKRTWSFGVYNAYGRRNPFYIDSSYEGFYMVSIMPFLPYISYSIDF